MNEKPENMKHDQKISVLLDAETRRAIDLKREEVRRQTGVFPSLSQVAGALIKRQLTQ